MRMEEMPRPSVPVAPPLDAEPALDLARRIQDLESAIEAIRREEAAGKKRPATPTVVPSGRIHFDLNGYNQNRESIRQLGPGATAASNSASTTGTDGGNLASGIGFRRVRLRLAGEALGVVNYSAEFDFAGAAGMLNTSLAGFRDVYVGVTGLPYVGNFRVGYFREPLGLEYLGSSNSMAFMERSTSDEGMFVPGRNLGAMLFNTFADEQGTWAIGGFATDPQQIDSPPGWFAEECGYALTLRGTRLLWYDEASGGRGLLHVGGVYSYRDNDPAVSYRFRARPETSLSPRVLDLYLPGVDHVQLLAGEAAAVYGPFSAQAECYLAAVQRDPAPGDSAVDPNFDGFYLQVGYFLTGEHRPYRKSSGSFDRVHPYENFFRLRDTDGRIRTGKGAWEIAYRYSYVDLLGGLPTTIRAFRGAGFLGCHTWGLNWYLNPYTRAMVNYVWCDMARVTGNGVDDTTSLVGGGHLEALEARFQIDF